MVGQKCIAPQTDRKSALLAVAPCVLPSKRKYATYCAARRMFAQAIGESGLPQGTYAISAIIPLLFGLPLGVPQYAGSFVPLVRKYWIDGVIVAAKL